MIHKVVSGVQVLAVVCAAAFVVLLFANEPSRPDPRPAADTEVDGQAIFTGRCAGCHGSDGAGAFGPQLSEGRVVERFPDAADQIDLVRGGRGAMPSFDRTLSDEEIQAVVEYTRSL